MTLQYAVLTRVYRILRQWLGQPGAWLTNPAKLSFQRHIKALQADDALPMRHGLDTHLGNPAIDLMM